MPIESKNAAPRRPRAAWRRVRQFFHQFSAMGPLHPDDERWISRWLTPQERDLFNGMSRRDQHHSVQVSRRAYALIDGEDKHRGNLSSTLGHDRRRLAKAGLLHDVGRRRGDVSIFDKVLVVVLRRWWPACTRALEKRGAPPEVAEQWRWGSPDEPMPTALKRSVRSHVAGSDSSERNSTEFSRFRLGQAIARAFYVQQVHAHIGAALTERAGTEPDVVHIIANHHEPLERVDSIVRLFSQADW